MQPTQHQQQIQQFSIVLTCSSFFSVCLFCSLRRIALFYDTLRLVIAFVAIVALLLHYLYWIPAKQTTSQAVAATATRGVCKAENGRVKRHRAAAAEDPLSYVRYDNALTLSSIERFVAQGLAPVSKLTLTLIFAAAPTLASKCLYAGAATYADKPQFVMLRASRPPACLKFL